MANDFTLRRSGESDLAYHKRLAKRLDERMREIERVSRQGEMMDKAAAGDKAAQKWLRVHPGKRNDYFYKGMNEYAYKTSLDKARFFSGGGDRFDVKPPTDPNALKSKLAWMRELLLKPTMSKKGVQEIYKKRLETFKKNWGFAPNMRWQDLEKWFNDEAQTYLDSKIPDSASRVKIIGTMSKFKDAKQLEKYLNSKKSEDLDTVQRKKLEELLKDEDFEKFYKGTLRK